MSRRRNRSSRRTGVAEDRTENGADEGTGIAKQETEGGTGVARA